MSGMEPIKIPEGKPLHEAIGDAVTALNSNNERHPCGEYEAVRIMQDKGSKVVDVVISCGLCSDGSVIEFVLP